MKIVLNRIDERLIHGQVLISWAKKLHAKQILVLDDALAEDELKKTVLSMTVPQGVAVKIFSVEAGARFIAAHHEGPASNAILLLQSLKAVRQLREAGYSLDSLNIGSISAGPARRRIADNVYVSPEEVGILRGLVRDGVDVYIQMVSASSRIEIKNILPAT